MIPMRDRIIQAASNLVEDQGFHATGMNDIVKASGAPKGSIYYYFPNGKEAIIADAVEFAGRTTAERIQAQLTSIADPVQAIVAFIEGIAHHVEASGFRAGGPLTIVASETATTSERLNAACRQSYDLIRDAFRSRLQDGGFGTEQADKYAVFITAAIEGGIILSRTYHSGDPLRAVASMMRNCLIQPSATDAKHSPIV